MNSLSLFCVDLQFQVWKFFSHYFFKHFLYSPHNSFFSEIIYILKYIYICILYTYIVHSILYIRICIYYCCCCSVTQSCPTLCNPMDCSTPGLPVHHQLPEFTQTHKVSDAIQQSHPLSSLSPPAFNLS